MADFAPKELARWVDREWFNGVPGGRIGRVCHDTRSIGEGDLYVAIRGERFDGHAFVWDAFAKGAAAALVQDDFVGEGGSLLRVPDTLRGLQDLARGYRFEWSARVIGITGSVGKTTVKEMCAAVLSVKGETHRTQGNYNNHIGLPLTMLALPRSAEFGVFELGMSHPEEIDELAELLRPEVAIITEICNAHRESFGSLDAIAQEKAALVARVPESGFVILDADSEWFPLMRERAVARRVTISFADVRSDYVGRAVSEGVLAVNGAEYVLPVPGEHMMRNALRAIALGLELGLSPEEVARGLSRFSNAPMRWQEAVVKGVAFVNDAYNANPLSMKAALNTFSALKGAGKKWAVLGGMRELGAASETEHAALGRQLDGLALDGIIAVGALASGIRCAQADRIIYCENAAEAASILKENLMAGDRVLLKASRGERLEQVLEFYEEI